MAEQDSNQSNQQYTVVARRYRPQSFTDLVGQSHISKALGNAIRQNRVGHAYLFTGARGVGKTSSARIFAKCLNCSQGPTSEPCNECDICQSVSLGEDVDVLEIDGASNRGIDEIRQLRSNAGVRPSRSRYKIYIIDEVHMLTQQAFNALLKTLEEPPEHVKFIFCTTDPQKIPITVLSRCQRFDFSPVQADEITNRLKLIATNEGVEADEKALALLARRAGGSMRDSQSLLEQLFSFCGDTISTEEVHQLLGTTDMGRIADLAKAMVDQDAAEALRKISQAVADGVDAGQMASQLLGYFRDMMASRVGCGIETMQSCEADDLEQLGQLAEAFGLETILNIVQILDAAVVRMQSSGHGRTLLEISVVRICNLQQLDSLADLVGALSANPTATTPRKTAPKKNGELNGSSTPPSTPAPAAAASQPAASQAPAPAPAAPTPAPAAPAPATNGSSTATATRPTTSTAVSTDDSEPEAVETKVQLAPGEVKSMWEKTLGEMGDMTADIVRRYQKIEMAAQGNLVVTLPDAYNRDLCNRPERKQKIESTFARISGVRLRIDFQAAPQKAEPVVETPKLTRRQQLLRLQEMPFVKKTLEIFDADIVDYREPGPKR